MTRRLRLYSTVIVLSWGACALFMGMCFRTCMRGGVQPLAMQVAVIPAIVLINRQNEIWWRSHHA